MHFYLERKVSHGVSRSLQTRLLCLHCYHRVQLPVFSLLGQETSWTLRWKSRLIWRVGRRRLSDRAAQLLTVQSVYLNATKNRKAETSTSNRHVPDEMKRSCLGTSDREVLPECRVRSEVRLVTCSRTRTPQHC